MQWGWEHEVFILWSSKMGRAGAGGRAHVQEELYPPSEGAGGGWGVVPESALVLGQARPGQQRASAGQGKADATVTPIKLRVELADEGGTQDPDWSSGWWDVHTVQGQCAQIIIIVGVLAGSKRVSPPPGTEPLWQTSQQHLPTCAPSTLGFHHILAL